ncbi:MAG: hypothetical protein WCB76_15525, partial [Acidobacteriaceae bacterium]
FEAAPVAGFVTDISALPALAVSAAGTRAVNFSFDTNIVASGVPFQLTVAPFTNPPPFTVSVSAPAPGATLVGTRGLLMKGTGLPACAAAMSRSEQASVCEARISSRVIRLSLFAKG